MTLSGLERGVFIKLFKRGGYVLDFSTTDFDTFTMESVRVALCEKYKIAIAANRLKPATPEGTNFMKRALRIQYNSPKTTQDV